jgi:hypothetical protein
MKLTGHFVALDVKLLAQYVLEGHITQVMLDAIGAL